MEYSFRKLIYSGVGFISMAVKNFEKAIKDIQEEGNLSDEEGERIVNSFKDEAGQARDEVESEFKHLLDNMLNKLHVARKSDIEKLNKRIRLLEEKLKISETIKEIDEDVSN